MFDKFKYYYSTLGPEIIHRLLEMYCFCSTSFLDLNVNVDDVNCHFSLINLFFKLHKAHAIVTILSMILVSARCSVAKLF